MLTLEKLKTLSPNQIFAAGKVIDSPEGINITNSGRLLKWVAVRGDIPDWAIYCHFDEKTYDYVHNYGDKVFSERNIKKLVPCKGEAFDNYRF